MGLKEYKEAKEYERIRHQAAAKLDTDTKDAMKFMFDLLLKTNQRIDVLEKRVSKLENS